MMNQTALQQKKLLENFFQAEEQRSQKEAEIQLRKTKAEKAVKGALLAKAFADSRRQEEIEALNQVKAKIDEALAVYQQLESDLSGFARPKHQLNLEHQLNPDDGPIEHWQTLSLDSLRGMLEEAQADFRLQTVEGNNSADTCASKAKQFGRKIYQRIEDYRQAKSEASSTIQKMRSEWESLLGNRCAKYIQSELSILQNQVDLANQHFEADTISDYRQALEISRQVSSKIGELTGLASQRRSELQEKVAAILFGSIVGAFLGLSGSAWLGVGGAIVGAIGGFITIIEMREE